jgi:3'-5' exoribonuclease
MREGQQLEGIYLIHGKTLATTRAGKPFLTLKIGDRSGYIEAKVWDDADKVSELVSAGDHINAVGRVDLYNGKLQLNLKSLRRVDEDKIDPADFLPSSSRDSKEMTAELMACIGRVEDSDLQKLLRTIFQDKELKEKFARAPAAKGMHHAYLGGLLEHSLSLFHLCERVIPHFPGVDGNLILAGALLHDLGKVDELSYTRNFDYTDQGRLIGHIVLELEHVSEAIRGIRGFPPEKAILLKHLLVSHHGKEEFGSPVKPMTIEALILNMMDDLDAKTQAFQGLMGSTSSERWSAYHPVLGQYVFKGFDKDGTEEEAEEKASPKKRRHPRLF